MKKAARIAPGTAEGLGYLLEQSVIDCYCLTQNLSRGNRDKTNVWI